ncbi:MAG: GIY-YIG nuclease family protein [Planctomycetaceae bacterium]|nr:GIY-YIG nuclease family protein [Planctomycetaceae bacterium]MCA9112600.1 GIY-YIG nuclease family protein [Planctomycetaceae bacterium]
MTREEILDEIRRLAGENEGSPPGQIRFANESGIRESEWLGRYWARWGDALIEAGYQPNLWRAGYEDEWVLEKLVHLIRQLDKFPTKNELAMHSRSKPDFPSHGVFRRLGTKSELALKAADWCKSRSGFDDVIKICEPFAAKKSKAELSKNSDPIVKGFVYLLKSGRHYKIGHTNSVARREYELGIQLPEKAAVIHKIETDDPSGIEAYWHKRFAEKRLNGEWFALTAADVRAFKLRRKFM